MKIAEKFPDETMFTIINNSLDWDIKLPAKNLYLLYISKYGFRELSSVFDNTDIELIMSSITDMYKDKWNSLHSKLLKDLLPDGGNEVENFTEKITENNTTTTSDNENTTTKVSAYNADDFANDESNTSIKDGNTIQDNTNMKKKSKDDIYGIESAKGRIEEAKVQGRGAKAMEHGAMTWGESTMDNVPKAINKILGILF